jgi:multiple sugar transport system ATP-binding protein
MPEVRLRELRKEFGDGNEKTVAVNGIDLTIDEGEFATLVGPSGCGKTTTLRCVAGLETPSSGSIYIGDREVTDLPPQERGIALLFQDIALYPHMTVRENIAYGLRINGVPKDERNEQTREAAELLQIEDQLDKKPPELSGGQQQRVALGRSIVRDPALFLFDEPMSNLDEKLKRELRPVIQRVTRQVGCPVLYVTHDQEEAMTLSDKIAVMNEGNLEQVGSPKEVYNDPRSQFVSSFIGQPTTQFFDATLRTEDDGVVLDLGDGIHVPIPLSPARLDGHVGGRIRTGVRPQDIEVVATTSEGIAATHVLDEPLGDATHSFFETDFGEIVAVTPPDFEGGQKEYGLKPKPEAMLLFDHESGERIA